MLIVPRASHTSLTKPGDVLSGRYELTRLIGQGGMGVVFEGRHVRLGTRVAIKVLRDDAADNPEIVRRFDREARAAARLASAHVAKVIDVDTHDDGTPFMVMEYLDGRDLDELLRDQGALPYTVAVDYVLQVCDAMAEAHALGIVHRDLKPDNLFLDESGATPIIKVLDFGISKIPLGDDGKRTETAASFGTPMYMSPDQIQSAKNVDARADIWSLGVILYELIGGKPPFDGENATAIIWSICMDEPEPLERVARGVPKPLADAVMKALEKDRARRYRSVAELVAALAPHGSQAAALVAANGENVTPDPPRARMDTPTVEMESPGSETERSKVAMAVTASVDDTTLPRVGGKGESGQTGGMVTPLPTRRATRTGLVMVAVVLGLVAFGLSRVLPVEEAATDPTSVSQEARDVAVEPSVAARQASDDVAPHPGLREDTPQPEVPASETVRSASASATAGASTGASAGAAPKSAPSASGSVRAQRRRVPPAGPTSTISPAELCRREPTRCR